MDYFEDDEVDKAMPPVLQRTQSVMMADALKMMKSKVSNQDVFLLFVTYDRNLNGLLDPEEVEELWGYLIGCLKNALPTMVADYAKTVQVEPEVVEKGAMDLQRYLEAHETKETIDKFFNLLSANTNEIHVNHFVERFQDALRELLLAGYEEETIRVFLEPQLQRIDKM